ncbi:MULTISPECIES: DUF2569 domain-containing protein [Providencia]|uniref:Putative membrane protein n=1 Tax=Providencia heimbachae ATCC 35613 TaxID=1354272 RepID=A0A1B7K4G4_9GAMM|nr:MULTISPECIES: DUF2569 domain-containing protein [Providencia]MBP6121485.1 DUF2569 domain-containing protein [Providencia sp.]MDD9341442.1 DUF2569 domain-containing protein [Providencia heimbachae]NIH22673.1 DUF2569 domain-containing protein [Providencia heimbachae]OAT55047.1 putative membrane protein [Providencia heimbachae ATCC 35613]QCJ70029.1 DUF2569 domain-containing protein [Providencia heimbachae]
MTSVYNANRITGWLLVPATYLLLTFLAVCSMTVMYIIKLYEIVTTVENWTSYIPAQWYLSFAISIAMTVFSVHVLQLMFSHSRHFPRRFTIWLLILLVIGLKTFAFSTIDDAEAVQVLAWPLLGAGFLVPYLKRSKRVKMTFTQDR